MSTLRNRCWYFRQALISIVLLFLPCCAVCAAEPAASGTLTMPSSGAFNMSSYKGKNLILFIYSIDDPRVDKAVQLMKELYTIRHEYNFDIVGISINPERVEEVQQYNQNKTISFPVYLDHNRLIYSKLKMTGGIGFYIFNKQNKLIASKLGSYTSQDVNLSENWRAFASNCLKFGYIPADQPVLGIQPPLPVFTAKTISGSMVDSKEIYKNKPVVVVIFSPKCSHCQDELTFLNSLYTSGDLKEQFEVVAISILDQQITADFINNQKYAFPVIADADKKLCSLFPSYTGSIPLSFVVNRNGSIVSLHKGFDEYQRNIYLMELKKLAALPNPPLLSKTGYSGEKTCAICHEKEHIQWKLTRHADAFLSLVRKGEEDNDKCISCHVTGFGSAGGYDVNNKKFAKNMENVQCESCHGPGYQSCSAFTGRKQKKKKTAEWKKLCLSCHTKKESINFVFAKRYPRILHTNTPDFTKMSRDERLQYLRSFREKQNVFDNPAKYVGAASCRECHTKEYSHWEKTAHAGVYKSAKAQAAPQEKLFRYNIGVGSAGGYPEPGREGVQCEACHGPGEKHLANPKAKGHGYIVGLGSECSSCVVEQICRRCHSIADDPEFDFQKEIEEVRHK
jgi:peroxiredoxin